MPFWQPIPAHEATVLVQISLSSILLLFHQMIHFHLHYQNPSETSPSVKHHLEKEKKIVIHLLSNLSPHLLSMDWKGTYVFPSESPHSARAIAV